MKLSLKVFVVESLIDCDKPNRASPRVTDGSPFTLGVNARLAVAPVVRPKYVTVAVFDVAFPFAGVAVYVHVMLPFAGTEDDGHVTVPTYYRSQMN